MLRSRIIWHLLKFRKGAFYVIIWLPREVLLKAYSSWKPQSETVRLSMWKGAPNNAEGKAKQCIGVIMSFCSILLRFLNRTFQNAEIRCSVWKQTDAHWSIAAAKRMNWNLEFRAEWLRISLCETVGWAYSSTSLIRIISGSLDGSGSDLAVIFFVCVQ